MKQINFPKPISIVVGLGKSGIGAAKLLRSEGEHVIVLEKSKEFEFLEISKELRDEGILVKHSQELLLSSFEPWLPFISRVVIGPGIPWEHQTLNTLRRKGIKIESEISLSWKRLDHIPWIGITGTNGKTTVTTMLKHIMEKNNIYSLMGGNIGISASQLALSCNSEYSIQPKYLIMELSSYQLETSAEIAPLIGIWTTLTPDHLERHKTLEKYFNIKKKLLDKSSFRIYNKDDKYLKSKRKDLSNGIWVSTQGPGTKDFPATFWINSKGKVCENNKEIIDTSVIKLCGEHNLQNLLLVTAAARKIGLSGDQIQKGIKTFKGVEHRLEKVGLINEITVFNDSKATNYDASSIGLRAMQSPSIVIAGGQSKQGNASEWLKQLKDKAIAVLLFGSSKDQLHKLIRDSKFNGNIFIYSNLKQATDASIKLALKLKCKSILFSPACASFDQYQNFEERGDHFKKLIKPFLKLDLVNKQRFL